jgi:hypothetical protein
MADTTTPSGTSDSSLWLPLLQGILAASGSAANAYGSNITAGNSAQTQYETLLLQQQRDQNNAAVQQALAQLQQKGFQSSQGQLALKNALQGGLLQGTKDVSIQAPGNIHMGTITGGLKPSALTGGAQIGSDLQRQSVMNLMQPDAASGGPMPALNTGAGSSSGLLPVTPNGLGAGPGGTSLVQPPQKPGALANVLNYALPVASTALKAYQTYTAGQAAAAAAAKTAAAAGTAAGTGTAAATVPAAAAVPAAATPAAALPTGSNPFLQLLKGIPGGGGGGGTVGQGLPTGIGTGIYDPQLGGSMALGVDQPGWPNNIAGGPPWGKAR